LLRNDIFDDLKIENKTHLENNICELKWSKKEILSLILKIIIVVLDKRELERINLIDIVDKNGELTNDEEKIKNGIYKIFGEEINKSMSTGTMDNWIIKVLSDGHGVVTPRVIYKFLSECLENEIGKSFDSAEKSKVLLSNFKKDYKSILLKVSKHKKNEYDDEYSGYEKYYKKIKKYGYKKFDFNDFKANYKKTSKKTIEEDLNKLIHSGFIMKVAKFKEKYEVANVYAPFLELKLSKQKTEKK